MTALKVFLSILMEEKGILPFNVDLVVDNGKTSHRQVKRSISLKSLLQTNKKEDRWSEPGAGMSRNTFSDSSMFKPMRKVGKSESKMKQSADSLMSLVPRRSESPQRKHQKKSSRLTADKKNVDNGIGSQNAQWRLVKPIDTRKKKTGRDQLFRSLNEHKHRGKKSGSHTLMATPKFYFPPAS
jgi:hypothetical protein